MQGVGTSGERTAANEVCIVVGPSIAVYSPQPLPRIQTHHAVGVHEVWGLLSLQHDLHSGFNNLDPWFEGTSEVHHPETFRLCLVAMCVARLLQDL
jgi:hypothetical protein